MAVVSGAPLASGRNQKRASLGPDATIAEVMVNGLCAGWVEREAGGEIELAEMQHRCSKLPIVNGLRGVWVERDRG